MAMWTNDHWVSNLHRVTNPPANPGQSTLAALGRLLRARQLRRSDPLHPDLHGGQHWRRSTRRCWRASIQRQPRCGCRTAGGVGAARRSPIAPRRELRGFLLGATAPCNRRVAFPSVCSQCNTARVRPRAAGARPKQGKNDQAHFCRRCRAGVGMALSRAPPPRRSCRRAAGRDQMVTQLSPTIPQYTRVDIPMLREELPKRSGGRISVTLASWPEQPQRPRTAARAARRPIDLGGIALPTVAGVRRSSTSSSRAFSPRNEMGRKVAEAVMPELNKELGAVSA